MAITKGSQHASWEALHFAAHDRGCDTSNPKDTLRLFPEGGLAARRTRSHINEAKP